MNNTPETRPVPAKVTKLWTTTRKNASGGKTIAVVAGGIAVVLIVAIVVAVATFGGGDKSGASPGGKHSGLDLVADYQAEDFPGDGVYRMKVAAGDRCLTAKKHGDDKPVLVQSDCDKAANLTAFAVAKGVYRITGAFGSDTETCLAVAGKARKTGANIKPVTCGDDPLQTFVTVPVKGGNTYALATATSGLCLAPAKDSAKSGTPVVTVECDKDAATQHVTLDKQDAKLKVLPVTGSYQVTVGHSKLCLGQGPELGNRKRNILVQLDCDAKDARLTFMPDKTGEKTRIGVDAVPEAWANCLAADPPGDEYGYLFGATECKDDKLQYFTVEPFGGNVYRIRVEDSGLCMGVKKQSGKAGVQVDMTECVDGQLAQLFTLKLATALPTKPTEFGAWWSDEAKEFGAKWEAPASAGGQEITGYLVEDCKGTELAKTDADTFEADIPEPAAGCVTVRALTAAGDGERARFQIDEK